MDTWPSRPTINCHSQWSSYWTSLRSATLSRPNLQMSWDALKVSNDTQREGYIDAPCNDNNMLMISCGLAGKSINGRKKVRTDASYRPIQRFVSFLSFKMTIIDRMTNTAFTSANGHCEIELQTDCQQLLYVHIHIFLLYLCLLPWKAVQSIWVLEVNGMSVRQIASPVRWLWTIWSKLLLRWSRYTDISER